MQTTIKKRNTTSQKKSRTKESSDEGLIGIAKFINASEWDGRKCVNELHGASERDKVNYGWKQMEWGGFYLEYCLRDYAKNTNNPLVSFNDEYEANGATRFDFKDNTTGLMMDCKVHVADESKTIVNDESAVRDAIERDGAIELFVIFGTQTPDDTGEFKAWHDAAKGKPSKYVRTAKRSSRTRKAAIQPTSISVYRIDAETLGSEAMSVMNQGKNSNGKPRPTKLIIDFDKIEPIKQLKPSISDDGAITWSVSEDGYKPKTGISPNYDREKALAEAESRFNGKRDNDSSNDKQSSDDNNANASDSVSTMILLHETKKKKTVKAHKKHTSEKKKSRKSSSNDGEMIEVAGYVRADGTVVRGYTRRKSVKNIE